MWKALLSSPFVAMNPRSRSVIVSTTTLRTAASSADLFPNRQPLIDHSDDCDAGGASPRPSQLGRSTEMLPAEALD